MMKKFLVVLLGTALAANLAACGCGTTNQDDVTTGQEEEAEEISDELLNQPAESEEGPVTDNMGAEEGNAGADNVSGETVGTVLSQQFHALLEENKELTPQEIADEIIQNPQIQFAGDTAQVEEGLLTGFGNAEITGFDTGVMFAPIIGSIPFVGYVFSLEEGADADSFVKLLEENANPRWNVCTEAEETVIETSENMVFFLMCPSQFE